jgi:gamma-glutamylcyclotransferase
MLYFAYGSNLWRKQMQDRCPGYEEMGEGVLKGYRWIISQRGYANIVVSANDTVNGVVYKLTASDIRSLDLCLVYVDPVEEEGTPWPEYVERINHGLSDSALSPAYITRYVRRFVPATECNRHAHT